jgi:hypothetical protein
MAITTAMMTSFKRDLFSALFCFNQSRTPTGDVTNTSFTITNMSSLTGLAVGMGISGTGIPANSVIASIDSATQITISKAATATNTGVTLTCTGDSFKIALIKISMAGTYGAASTNYTDITGNTDEVSGTGYSAGGTALTNVSPTSSGTTAFVDFSPDPSWTSASFSTAGCMIYNNARRGPTATIGTSVHDFGGTQTVTAGTFTAVMPVADASNAILRIA